ncbi:CYTH domain-containing protein [Parelusimicrobium proximum]|uniref:CYTH domain-containing protein n=1 Tax=Parelusimicrobium proximum TaxID=3228953 RepID=UPI003D1789CA
MEKEFKWTILNTKGFNAFKSALAALPLKIEDKGIVPITDIYLDTDKQLYTKKNTAVRIRVSGGKFTLTVKKHISEDKGMIKREENNTPLKSVSVSSAVKEAQDILKEKLIILFVIKNKRGLLKIKAKYFEAEVCLDSFVLYVKGREIKMREVEMEFVKGDENYFLDAAENITAASKLSYSKMSKVKTARAALKYFK